MCVPDLGAVHVQVSDAILDACLEQDPDSKVNIALVGGSCWLSSATDR